MLWRQRRCSAVNRKTAFLSFFFFFFFYSILALKSDFFVKKRMENDINVCKKDNLKFVEVHLLFSQPDVVHTSINVEKNTFIS